MFVVKRIMGLHFADFIFLIEENHKEMGFNIYLRRYHKVTNEEINLQLVEDYRKYYGKGFNIQILSDNEREFLK